MSTRSWFLIESVLNSDDSACQRECTVEYAEDELDFQSQLDNLMRMACLCYNTMESEFVIFSCCNLFRQDLSLQNTGCGMELVSCLPAVLEPCYAAGAFPTRTQHVWWH